MSCSVISNKFGEYHDLEWITPQKVVVYFSNNSYNSSSPEALNTVESSVVPQSTLSHRMVTVSVVLVTVLLANLGSAFIAMERQGDSEARQIRVTPHLLVRN